jgi:hypothetical protein
MEKFVGIVVFLLMFSGCEEPRHYEDVLICSYNVVDGNTQMVVAPLSAPENLHTMVIAGVVPAWQGARVHIEWTGGTEPGKNARDCLKDFCGSDALGQLVSVRRLP